MQSADQRGACRPVQVRRLHLPRASQRVESQGGGSHGTAREWRAREGAAMGQPGSGEPRRGQPGIGERGRGQPGGSHGTAREWRAREGQPRGSQGVESEEMDGDEFFIPTCRREQGTVRHHHILTWILMSLAHEIRTQVRHWPASVAGWACFCRVRRRSLHAASRPTMLGNNYLSPRHCKSDVVHAFLGTKFRILSVAA